MIKAKSKVSMASTMEELLKKTGEEITIPKQGSTIKGVITGISRGAVLFDIGAKTEGVVTDKELELVKDYVRTLKEGDELSVYVLSSENDRGQILLALREESEEWQWSKLEQWMETGKPIEVRGIELNRGGIVARIDKLNLRGFVPISQIGRELSKKDDLVNKVFKVKIIDLDRKKKRLIFSERQVSEAAEIGKLRDKLAKVKEGEKSEGKIVAVRSFGLLVELKNGLTGLVHVSEIGWEREVDWDKRFKEGSKLEVMVIGKDLESGKLDLSLKRLMEDPWMKIVKELSPGKKVKGEVVRVNRFGAVVRVRAGHAKGRAGVEGFLHISKIPSGQEPKVGDKIKVVVEDVDVEGRRIGLGMVLETVSVAYR